MAKILLFSLLMVTSLFSVKGQTNLARESFETDGEGTRYNSNTFDDPPNCSFFFRTDTQPSCHADAAAGADGSFYWASENVKGGTNGNVPAYIELAPIDITDATNLETKILVGVSNGNGIQFDADDQVLVRYSLDGSGWDTAGTIGSATLNGLTNSLQDFSFSIPGTGSKLEVMVVIDQIGETEELLLDDIRISGDLIVEATCNSGVIVNLDDSGSGSLTPAEIFAGDINARGIQSISVSPSQFNCSNIGPNRVTLTLVDLAGNTTSCTSEVNVEDDISPIVSCPPNISVSNDPGQSGAKVDFVTPVGLDNCSEAKTLQTAGSPGSLLGVTPRTVINSAEGWQEVSLSSPVSVRSGETVWLAWVFENGLGMRYTSGTPGRARSAGIWSGGMSADFGTCEITGYRYSIYCNYSNEKSIVTTSLGYTDVYNLVAKVSDRRAMPVTFTEDGDIRSITIYHNGGTGNMQLGVYSDDPGLPSGSFFPVGSTTNSFLVTDASGNVDQCSFTVTVKDDEAPAITCPANISVDNDPGQCGAVVTYSPPVGVDNCPGVITTQTAGLGNGAFFPTGTTTETYRATDAAGNISECSFTVTVNDAEPPVIRCPSNISVNNDPGKCGARVSYSLPAFDDNCGVVAIIGNGWDPGDFFPVGTTTVNYKVADAAGNMVDCSFNVTVADVTPPVLPTPPAPVTAECAYDVPPLIDLTAIDNCDGPITVSPSLNTIEGACANDFVQIRTWTFTDQSGNTGKVSQTVTVKDISPPNLISPADEVVYIDPEYNEASLSYSASATDNCNASPVVIATIGGTPVNWPYHFPIGTTEIKWQAADNCGNVSSHIQFVTVDQISTTTDVAVTSNTQLNDGISLKDAEIPTDIAETEGESFTVDLYPNPSTGEVNLKINSVEIKETEITVRSMTGRKLLHEKYPKSDLIKLDLSKQASGTYLISIKQDDVIVLKKLVLNRNR